ncbi:MAG: protein translocase subunit SecD [Alphaproteobacteria bacterium]|nr:protein translocase subunit SecD [Alphaproteobacteria bacterium]
MKLMSIHRIVVSFAKTMGRFLRSFGVLIVVLGAVAYSFYTLYPNKIAFENSFIRGLDIAGGVQFTYHINTKDVARSDVDARLDSLKVVIERRVNGLGVSEPQIFIASGGIGNNDTHKLVVELPGVTDVAKAVEHLGKTPHLQFKVYSDAKKDFVDTALDGTRVEHAQMQFLQGHVGSLTNTPVVALTFDSKGRDLFAKLTKDNIGKQLGIYLDGALISAPVIQEAIPGGTTQITGSFTITQAQQLAQDLSLGALPLQIALESTKTVDATLGNETLTLSVRTGLVSILAISIFMLVVYRGIGLLGVVALGIYTLMTLLLFKHIPVVLSASSLAAFIMSVGLAVDANVLIFERIREELQSGKIFKEAVEIGFNRAWTSIRDSHISAVLIAILLFWFGVSAVKGFAFTFILGVGINLISSFIISRIFLRALAKIIRGGGNALLIAK